MQQIKKKTEEWRKEIKNNEAQFKKFYNFVFDYLREEKTVLGKSDKIKTLTFSVIEEATTLWNIVLKDRKWDLYDSWLEFLTVSALNSNFKEENILNMLIQWPISNF